MHSQERVSVLDPTDTVCRNAADPMSLAVTKSALRPVEIERKDSSMQAYCLKCRAHTDINDAEQVTLKNGRPATRGKCAVCTATVFRIGRAT